MLLEIVENTVTYGRSTVTIGEQLFGDNPNMTEEDRTKAAQKIYDGVMNSFSGLRDFMLSAQARCAKLGYTETILGRRRHNPDMMLPEFEFKPMQGYVNPDVDPLDISTLENRDAIPQRIVDELTRRFKGYKYWGQIVKATKELADQKIRVINNRNKLQEASRKVVNCVDKSTEILTINGWKRYDEISVGDAIYSFNVDTQEVVEDVITHIHVSDEPTEVIDFISPTFRASSTLNHRWVVCEADESPRIRTTANIWKNKWPDYPILRVGDNSFIDTEKYSDNDLKLIGWLLTDGSIGEDVYSAFLYQSVNSVKNAGVYHDMISTLNEMNQPFTDCLSAENYHSIYLKKSDRMMRIVCEFPDRILTPQFIATLSQRQAKIVMKAMLSGDGSGVDCYGNFKQNTNVRLACSSKRKADMFQYLCFRAGFATNSYQVHAEDTQKHNSCKKVYSSVSNTSPVVTKNDYYEIAVLKSQRAQIYQHHKFNRTVEDGVWCVTTTNGTWISRHDGCVSITGNSIIQGSAAELTKMAILKLEHNERWKEIGGRFIIPVHDELIVEVPIEHREEGEKLLKESMESAGDFLPFPIYCDVTTTYRWYGLEVDNDYVKPTTIDTVEPQEVKWIQYMLFENEYVLPVYKEPDGSKPRGNAAMGINGRRSEELDRAIFDYMNRYRISEAQFLDHIEHLTIYGEVKEV